MSSPPTQLSEPKADSLSDTLASVQVRPTHDVAEEHTGDDAIGVAA